MPVISNTTRVVSPVVGEQRITPMIDLTTEVGMATHQHYTPTFFVARMVEYRYSFPGPCHSVK